MKDSLWAQLRLSCVPSSWSTTVGGIAIVAIIDEKRNMAKKMTSMRRIFAMSWYLRKYLRSVMSAARCEDDESAQM
jgi:hypothetical protein